MRYVLKDLVDIPRLQELTDHLFAAAGIPSAIIAADGEILTGSGWQRICTEFHRRHPEIERQCIESDFAIRQRVDAGDPFVAYTCPRGLTDASVPIVIEGEHLANAFVGQIFTRPPDATTEARFRENAHEFGLDTDAYMEAFREIPVIGTERLRPALFFLAQLARMVAELGLQRKRELEAYERLRASEKHAESILAAIPDLMFRVSREGVHLDFHAPDPARLYLKPEQFLGKNVRETLPANVADTYMSNVGAVLDRGELRSFDYELAFGEGDVRSYEARMVRSGVDEVFVIVRENTDRRRAEAELRASEEKFRLLAENVSDAIWTMDLNQRFTYLSPSAQKVWGYTPEEGLRVDMRATLTPESYELATRKIAEEFARDGESGVDPNRTHLMELEQIHKDGSRYWSEVTAKFLRDADGTIRGIIGATRDVTVRRRAELILRTRLELSERIAEADIDALLQQTLDCAEQLTGSSIGFFHFVEPDQTSLRLQTWSTNTIAKMCTAEGKGQHYPIGLAGVWADCFYTRAPVIHNDYASVPDKKGMPEGHAPVVRELVVPMVRNNLVFAILGVGNKPTDYTDEDVRNVQSLATLAMEVVARKQAEDALRAKSGELDQYFTRALDLFCIADTDGYFRRMNQQWETTLGYPLAVLEDSRFLDLVHPEDLDETMRAVSRLSEQSEVIDFVNRYRCADGTYRWIEWRAYPQDKNIFAAARDITGRMESERALRESEALLRQAQDAAQLGHYILEVATGIWSCSAALERVFGIEPNYRKDVEGWLNIVHPDDRDMMAAYFRDEVLGKGQKFDKVYRIVRAEDGTTQWVHGQGELTLGPDGVPVTMFGIIQNITKDVEAEMKTDQLQEQLQQAMKLEAVGRLAGGVAHDFNNLLTIIGGNVDLLLEETPPHDSAREELSEIKKAAERAASLTAQLLAFSRKQMIAPRVVDISELVAGSTRMLKRLIGEDIELFFAPCAESGKVKVDPHQMEQVFINLAVNARDAMPRGGVLRVETGTVTVDEEEARSRPDAAPGTYVCLCVADTGVGIPSEILPHLFEPFFTTKEQGKGTGLG
ncbi:MAG: PAS domain S-box protein, partial [Deltaproteobacteria bacterium]|nr:PAS domain S-box protein [Deltaproteobacteria bacterium]